MNRQPSRFPSGEPPEVSRGRPTFGMTAPVAVSEPGRKKGRTTPFASAVTPGCRCARHSRERALQWPDVFKPYRVHGILEWQKFRAIDRMGHCPRQDRDSVGSPSIGQQSDLICRTSRTIFRRGIENPGFVFVWFIAERQDRALKLGLGPLIWNGSISLILIALIAPLGWTARSSASSGPESAAP